MRALVALAAFLAAACQCGPEIVTLPDGGQAGGSSSAAGGGNGGGAGGGSHPCGGACPAGKVCDESVGRCVGGCPPGQGTCAAGCCAWGTADASVPFAMSGRWPALLLDQEDRAFIVHRGYAANRLVHLSTQTDAGDFEHSAVYYQGGTSSQLDVIEDPDGGRWLTYEQAYMNNTHDVTLVHLAGDDRGYETVGHANPGTPSGLASHQGVIYVLWHQWFGGMAMSQRIGDGGFVTRQITFPNDPSWMADLRIDATGLAHVAYGSAGSTGGVFYGEGRFDAGFAFQQVAGEVSISRVALELEPDGTPQLAYSQLDGGHLYWSRRIGSGWKTEAVTTARGEGWNPALVLDPTRRPHVSYWALDGGSLHYAVRVGENAWDTQTVDVGPNTGAESELALTKAGRPCIAYSVVTSTYYGLRYGCLPQ